VSNIYYFIANKYNNNYYYYYYYYCETIKFMINKNLIIIVEMFLSYSIDHGETHLFQLIITKLT